MGSVMFTRSPNQVQSSSHSNSLLTTFLKAVSWPSLWYLCAALGKFLTA